MSQNPRLAAGFSVFVGFAEKSLEFERATIEFARNILKQLCDEETMKKVEYGMQYEHSFRELTKMPE